LPQGIVRPEFTLIDQATIFVRAGKGGDGCLSFRREKFVPKGGPDGGDGGRGGHVILEGDSSMDTLLSFNARPHYRAKNGQPGSGKSMSGAAGDDLVVPVPLGTVVTDRDTGACIADIQFPGQREVIARGGEGGLGNEHFKSATNQTPRETTPGEEGEERTLDLELKLIADAGLIGLPNAGKSTLLSVISRATPKIADYPFTTLQPNLGMAELSDHRRIVFADIPGLIEGASQGAGLGHDFLRHVDRTKLLVHLVEIMPIDGSDPIANYETIRNELFQHSAVLAEKPEIIVFSKIDLMPDEEDRRKIINRFSARLGLQSKESPLLISAATRSGIDELLERCWSILGKADEPAWKHEREERAANAKPEAWKP